MGKESSIFHRITEVSKLQDGGVFEVFVKFCMSDLGWIDDVKFSIGDGTVKTVRQMKHMKNDEEFAYFKLEEPLSLKTSALYYYYFSFKSEGNFRYYKKKNRTGENSVSNAECWKLAVNFSAPEWAKNAIMYHIFVDRYRRSSKERTELIQIPGRTIHTSWNEPVVLGPNENGDWNVDFYGGNAKGIEETLDYIKKLGVTILYLSPIVESTSNHRYDTGDYRKVDPYFGTNEEMRSLCDKAHRKGMKVILDGVFNHTGNGSKYFNEYGRYDTVGAFQSVDSPYFPFYKVRWEDGKLKFSYWYNIPNVPECNWYSKEWPDFICGEGGVIDYWYQEFGIDGIRYDVVDEISDEGVYLCCDSGKRNNSDSLFIGEVWKNPMRQNRGYMRSGKGMHTVMNYQWEDSLIRYYKYGASRFLQEKIEEIMTEYPEDSIRTLMNFTSTHDISRLSEIFARDCFNKEYGDEKWAWNLLDDSMRLDGTLKLSNSEYKQGRRTLMLYIFTIMFMPGIVSIFYGDEVGLGGLGNLANRAPYPWGRRDKKLLKFFREVGKARISQEFLKNAEFEPIEVHDWWWSYKRYDDENMLVVYFNNTEDVLHPTLLEGYKEYEIIANLNNCTITDISPYGAIAIKLM